MKKSSYLIIAGIIFIICVTYFSQGGKHNSQAQQNIACVACNGSKLCSLCSGTGNYVYNGLIAPCSYCNGSGVCQICGGANYAERAAMAAQSAPQPLPYSVPQVDNSSSIQPTRTICISCGGSGSCSICGGTGRYSNYGFTSGCSACDDYGSTLDGDGKPCGNGRCSTCHGTGFTQ